MTFNVDTLRLALSEVPGALSQGSPPNEPGWLSNALPDSIWPAAGLTILESGPRGVGEDDDNDSDGGTGAGVALATVQADVAESGVDALAWYRSFRTPDVREWGIFIHLERLATVAPEMFRGARADPGTMGMLAYEAVLTHERTHFGIDAVSAQLEILTRRALWGPHKASHGYYDQFEEAIANAAMLRGMRTVEPRQIRVIGREASLRNWTHGQPDGYKYGHKYTPEHKFDAALNEQGATILSRAFPVGSVAANVTIAPSVRALIEKGSPLAPVYLVGRGFGARVGDVGFFPCVKIVGQSRRFEKSYERVSQKTQRAYHKLKQRLGTAPAVPGDDLKRWRPRSPRTWSLRLNSSDRLHLEHKVGVEFVADEIGPHTKMGHG